MGASAWQAMDVMTTARDFAYEDTDDFVFVQPYLKRVDPNVNLAGGGTVDRSITIDGDLSDWNFAFPIDFNRESIPDSSRAYGWLPGSNDSLSGTIWMQYDDEYLYVAASVKDYCPGAPSAGWASDGVEVYLANWDIEDSLHTGIEGFPDDENGNYAVQIGIYLNGTEQDSIIMTEYYQVAGDIKSENTVATFNIWPDEDGYDLEAKIKWSEIDAASEHGNSLKPAVGTRVPATWSIFSVDETGAGSFEGYQYTCVPNAPWMGASAFQYVDVKGISFSAALDTTVTTGIADEPVNKAASFKLAQNYPNPFNPTTNIEFTLDKPGEVSLNIYDIRGNHVKTIFDNSYRKYGKYSFSVDMSKQPSGIYIYALQVGDKKLAKKMMLLK